MMDFGQVGRLLRQDWSNPTDLARELYAMFTSKESRRMANPVSIEVPRGQTGIVISRENSPGPAAAAIRNQTTIKRPNVTQVPATDKPSVIRTDLAPQRAAKEAPDSAFARPRFSGDDGQSYPQAEDSKPTPGDFSRGASYRPPAPNRQLNGPQVQTGPDFKPVRSAAVPPQSPSKAYSKPVFEASGEIRFSGVTPVQFDTPPMIFNPVTDEYEPYDHDGHLTRIPLDTDDGDSSSWGKVLSGSGDTYQVQLYDDPSSPPGDIVSVTIWVISPEATIPPGAPLYPITVGADGNYYSQVPIWMDSAPSSPNGGAS